MKIFRVEFPNDPDNMVVSQHEAMSMRDLLESDKKQYESDDRLSPCYGVENKITIDGDSICWNPGDGGVYTVATYFTDHDEMCEFLKKTNSVESN